MKGRPAHERRTEMTYQQRLEAAAEVLAPAVLAALSASVKAYQEEAGNQGKIFFALKAPRNYNLLKKKH